MARAPRAHRAAAYRDLHHPSLAGLTVLACMLLVTRNVTCVIFGEHDRCAEGRETVYNFIKAISVRNERCPEARDTL